MEKKISILIIFLFLISNSYSVAKDANILTNKGNSTKVQIIKKEDKSLEAKTYDSDTVFTQNEVIKTESTDVLEQQSVKRRKFLFSFLNKVAKNKVKEEKNADNSLSSDKKVITDVKDQKSLDKTNKKLERVKEAKLNHSKVKSKDEVKVNSDSEKSSQVVEGSVATNKIISIDDCVKMALANNPSIVSAMNTSDIYKNKIAQAWSAYFPTLGADVNYSRNDMMISNFAFPNQKYGMYNTPKISAQMLLFDFGKTKASADISKKSYEASQNNLQSNINDVIFNVKKAYFNLLFATQQEEVLAKSVRDYELHLKQAQAFYKIGTKAKIDVMTAEYNLGKAKLDYIKATNSVALAYAQINNAMGLPEYCNYTVTDKLESKSYKIEFNDIIKTAYDTRPELLAAKKKAEGSEILIKASLRAFAPDINAFGNYVLGGSSPSSDYSYQFGAGLSYKPTNLYLLKKQVDEAKSTYKRDLADYQNSKQKVYLDVKQAYIELYNAQDSIPVAKLSMKQAKEQYALASGRYKVGMGDAIELKDAENTYRTSQLDYYSTLMNYHVAAANIERVIGSPVKPSDESLL